MSIVPFVNVLFGEVRVVMKNEEPWFVAADICRALDLSNVSEAIRPLEEDYKGISSIDTIKGKQTVSVLNEHGVYDAQSKLVLPPTH